MGRRGHLHQRPPASPLADALARVGDRWTLLVVAALLEREKRFNELSEELGGIAPNVLSGRLKLLGEQGLVVSRAYSERPQRQMQCFCAVSQTNAVPCAAEAGERVLKRGDLVAKNKLTIVNGPLDSRGNLATDFWSMSSQIDKRNRHIETASNSVCWQRICGVSPHASQVAAR